jgi:hypothetical protein
MISEDKPGPDGKPKADPAMYTELRDSRLRMRFPGMADSAVQAVLMDWRVSSGHIVTVLACVDGTASIYLSSGGGYLGGGQGNPAVREAALTAVYVAERLIDQFEATESTDLPVPGEVQLFVVTNAGFRRGSATESRLQQESDPLQALWNAMQMVVTQYRLNTTNPSGGLAQ